MQMHLRGRHLKTHMNRHRALAEVCLYMHVCHGTVHLQRDRQYYVMNKLRCIT